MADGHLNKCIDCCKAASNQRRKEKIDEIREYDRKRGELHHRKEANRIRQKTEKGKEAHRLSMLKYEERYKNRKAAHIIFSNAVRDKKVFKLPCFVCGELNVEGHHPDYERPLDVVWLCEKHHKETHKMANEINRKLIKDSIK